MSLVLIDDEDNGTGYEIFRNSIQQPDASKNNQNEYFLEEEPISLTAQNIPSYMGGMS